MLTHIASWSVKVKHRNLRGTSRARQHRDQMPLHVVALTFLAALGMLAISLFWPYMLLFAVTIEQTAAPHSGLAFMFLGAGTFAFPLMLLFSAIDCWVLPSKSHPQVPAFITTIQRHRTNRRDQDEAGHSATEEDKLR